MMVADDLELAMVVEVSNEPLGSSGCRRRCRCCGSFVVAEMALKPKSKHKGVSTKTKNEGCCQNFGQAELPVLRGGTSGPRAELPVLPGGTSGRNQICGLFIDLGGNLGRNPSNSRKIWH